MKQLTYTSCIPGRSVSGSSGFQVRAVSQGLTAQQLWQASTYAGYKLPDGMVPCDEAVGKAPIRLALFDTPNLGRVLVHGVYAGKEGDGQRQGNFFTHLLLGVPADFDAGQAIRSWGSSFWKKRDDNGPVTLPETDPPPPNTQSALSSSPLGPTAQEMLRFLMDALMLPALKSRKIILAAPAHEVAVCLAVAARLLPTRLLQGLTFSTYESSPLNSTARVVGTCWANDQPRDLPANCYSGACIGFNSFNGKKSDLPGQSLYADRAIRSLLPGKEQEIDSFLAKISRCEVGDAELLELAFAVAADRCNKFSDNDMHRLLSHSGLGPETVGKPSALTRIVELGNSDADFFRKDLPSALRLIEDKDVLGKEKTAKLDGAVRDRLESWLDLEAFRRKPELSAPRLRKLTMLIGAAPSDARVAASADLLDADFRSLFALEDLDIQPHVENVLRVFSGVTPGGLVVVYRGLWDRYLNRPDHKVCRPTMILALTAVGVGSCAEDLAHAMEGQLGEVLEQSLRQLRQERSGRLSIRVVRNAIRGWPREFSSRVPRFLRPASRWKWPVYGLALLIVLSGVGLGVAWATGHLDKVPFLRARSKAD